MTKKKKDEDLRWLATAIGFVFLLPVLITAFIYYIYIYFRYIAGKDCRRVMDIRRVVNPIDNGVLMLGITSLGFFLFLPLVPSVDKNYHTILIVTFLIFLFIICIISSMRIATLYMGVLINRGKDYIAIPHDMQSYGILGYITLKFIIDYGCVDTIKISQISKISRGHGKDLYLHGEFGSRCIRMSSKQKRDECLAIIQGAIKKKGVLVPEIEGY